MGFLLFVALYVAAILICGAIIQWGYNEVSMDTLIGGSDMAYPQGTFVAAVLLAFR